MSWVVGDLVGRYVSHFDCQNITHPPVCMSGLPICMHHQYMCIVMEIVLRCCLPPGARAATCYAGRQADKNFQWEDTLFFV